MSLLLEHFECIVASPEAAHAVHTPDHAAPVVKAQGRVIGRRLWSAYTVSLGAQALYIPHRVSSCVVMWSVCVWMRWRVHECAAPAAVFLSPCECQTPLANHSTSSWPHNKPMSANNHATSRKRPMKEPACDAEERVAALQQLRGQRQDGRVHGVLDCCRRPRVCRAHRSPGDLQAIQINEPDGAQIQQIRGILPRRAAVIAPQWSLQLYTPDAQRLLHGDRCETTGTRSTHALLLKMVLLEATDRTHFCFPSPGVSLVPQATRRRRTADQQLYTGASEFVCVGVSTGNVCVVPFLGRPLATAPEPGVQLPHLRPDRGQAPHNDPSRACVSADGNGDVHVTPWRGRHMGPLHDLLRPDPRWHSAPGARQGACARGGDTAYNTGAQTRVPSHRSDQRPPALGITIETHPDGRFATASEDTTIALWAFNEGTPDVREPRQVDTRPGCALSGVAFCGGFDRTTSRAPPTMSPRCRRGGRPRRRASKRCLAWWCREPTTQA